MVSTVEFDRFYAETRPRLLRQLTIMVGNREVAQDALHDAYERAWQRWPKLLEHPDVEAWVRTVAWRRAVDGHRRSTVLGRLLPRLAGRPGEEGGSTGSAQHLDLQAALGQLTPEQRRAIVLHHLAGLPVDEIARETGVAVGTVKSRLGRARATLAAALGGDYLVEGGDTTPGGGTRLTTSTREEVQP